MDLFWKASAGVLIALILTLVLEKQERDISGILSITVCLGVMGIAVFYLEPVLDFIQELKSLVAAESDLLAIPVKILGIGLVCQIAGTVCVDARNSALGKTVEILGGAVILYLSLPIFSYFLEVLQQILEGV